MLSKIFSQLNLLRFGLAASAVAIILLVLPHADHQGFSYEQNQPWKYPLLTADFDIPILRDSTSIRVMRDSIDRTFVPFVKRDLQVEKENINRFNALISQEATPGQAYLLTSLLTQTYEKGILDNDLIEELHDNHKNALRLVTESKDNTKEIVALDFKNMFSARRAYTFIDSVYEAQKTKNMPDLSQEITRALNLSLNANIVLDSVTDSKYRDQEYLTVNGALGVIKTGQRIVDRGEIITPQIFTNLNTYQEMLATRQSDRHDHTYFIIGQGLYIAVILTVLYIFLSIYRPLFFSDIRKMTFLITFITLFTLFAILMFENVIQGLFVVPFAAVPVIVLVFFDSRTAIFSLIATVFLSALVSTYPLQFLFMELIVGLVATFSIWQLDRRSQLLRTAVLSLITYVFTYFIMLLIMEGNFSQFSWRILAMFLINSVILSFAYVLILVIEKIFGFTSAVTLVELSDINSPLLRRLAEEAPGTFQHSIQVSTIAAEAARAVGANTTLVRTGALYHDIGKLSSPIFFTENQHGINPHQGLDPVTSAKKIISHVTEGAALANKHKLPALVKSFILEHHGKGMAKYFYTTAVNNNPDKVIDKGDFSYPGPNPKSVETSILMMADAVEAASRSLTDYSPESIDRLVENIINGQIADGMFKESPISFKDVEIIKSVFKKRLATIYHTRVRYPEMKKDTATAQNLNQKENA
ncbi:MAG: HDIG domain-containing protein [Muribaculaceae bacterium]|nr:HDIG domain-containing protein [Muribaculaceae bacterium]